jgi:GH15 family glucan-1,4-alpha-glucosidase
MEQAEARAAVDHNLVFVPMSRRPRRIEDYALLGDLHTAALSSEDGALDWLCVPRFDSPACFSTLLDDEQAGTWRIAPAGRVVTTRRRYRGDTLVLDTERNTSDGTVRLTEAMPPRGDGTCVVRVVEGVTGRVPMRMLFRPRFGFGHTRPWVRVHAAAVSAVAGPDALWLHSEAPLVETDQGVTAAFSISAGQRLAFTLTYTTSYRGASTPVDPFAAIAGTEAFWSDWIGRHEHAGPWDSAVRRALITLKALTYAPTGGIAEAATGSLPTRPGRSPHRDHRRCSLATATSTLHTLIDAGYADEARAWREWLVRAVAGNVGAVRSTYALDGAQRPPAYPLGRLAGHQSSTSTRVDDDLDDQLHLNVWGEVLDGLHLVRESGLSGPDADWDVQRALLDHLEGSWRRPDAGLWDTRGHQHHFVHSKVMAWAAVDRAVRAVERHRLPGPATHWRALRAQIRAEVCTKGYDPHRNTFTQYYGSHSVDAALLLLPRVGFLPWRDTRVRGTVETVRRELCERDLLVPYRTDDRGNGLPEFGGAHLAANFWLVDALHGRNQHREARALFEKLLDLRNDVGLLSEGYDVTTRRQVGNVPHTPAMAALVSSAKRLAGDAHRSTTVSS